MKKQSPFYKTGTSRSPFNAHHGSGHLKPKHGETYGDFHTRTSGGATNKWGQKETNKKLLNEIYSDSSKTFIRNPKYLNLNPTELKAVRNKGKYDKKGVEFFKGDFAKPNEGENRSDYNARVFGNPGFAPSNETYTGGEWKKNN